LFQFQFSLTILTLELTNPLEPK